MQVRGFINQQGMSILVGYEKDGADNDRWSEPCALQSTSTPQGIAVSPVPLFMYADSAQCLAFNCKDMMFEFKPDSNIVEHYHTFCKGLSAQRSGLVMATPGMDLRGRTNPIK